MGKEFNGTTLSFGGEIVGLRSIDFDEGDGETNVSGSEVDQEEYAAAISDPSVTIEAVGAAGIVKGDTGDLAIVWNDGSSTPIGTAVCTGNKVSGKKNDAITHTLKFRKAQTET